MTLAAERVCMLSIGGLVMSLLNLKMQNCTCLRVIDINPV